jgi:hypothetical protein
MKIALCLSGQPRFIKEVSPYILKNVCEGYDVDTFFHFWFDEDLINKPYKYGGNGGWIDQRIDPNAINDAINIYNPKNYKVEPSKKFYDNFIKTDYCFRDNGELISWTKHWKESNEPDYRNRMVNNTLSNFYSMNQVLLLKKEEEYKNNKKYDYVIRMRSDCVIHTKLIYESYDNNKVHYTGILNQPDKMVADWINFGNSINMDVFMGIFSMFDKILNKCKKNKNGAWSNEMLHKTALDIFEIETQSNLIFVEVPRF